MRPISGERMARVSGRKRRTLIRPKGSHRTFASPGGETPVTVPFHAGDLWPETRRSIMKDAGPEDEDLRAGTRAVG